MEGIQDEVVEMQPIDVHDVAINLEDSEEEWTDDDLDIRRLLWWGFERDIFGMEEGQGRDLVIAASDGSLHEANTLQLYRLFREMALKGENLWFSLGPINFHFWEDGFTTQAFLAFLSTNETTFMRDSINVTFRLLKLGYKYKLEQLAAAAVQVLMDKIDVEACWSDPESLWLINAWLLTRSDRNNGEMTPELVPLKKAIAKAFNKQVTKARKQKVRSPAGGQNLFGNYWESSVNFIL